MSRFKYIIKYAASAPTRYLQWPSQRIVLVFIWCYVACTIFSIILLVLYSKVHLRHDISSSRVVPKGKTFWRRLAFYQFADGRDIHCDDVFVDAVFIDWQTHRNSILVQYWADRYEHFVIPNGELITLHLRWRSTFICIRIVFDEDERVGARWNDVPGFAYTSVNDLQLQDPR